MKFKEGDLVSLPLGEEGVIVKINDNIVWGFKYLVRITKGGIFNNVGSTHDFKEEQLTLREPVVQEIMESNSLADDSHGVEFVTHFSETVESLEHRLNLERWKHNECVKRIQESISDKYKHEQTILELTLKIDKLRHTNVG